MGVFDWLAIGAIILLPACTIWWCCAPQTRAKLKLQVRLAAVTTVLLVGLALGLLVFRSPDPAHRQADDEDGDEYEVRTMKVFCYAPHITDLETSSSDAPVRRRALERVVPEAQPTQDQPAAPPPTSPVDGGTSCRLHPRVLEKVLLSIGQAERRQLRGTGELSHG